MTLHPSRVLRRIGRLRAHEFRDVARAQVAILEAHWLMWRRPAGGLLTRAPEHVGPERHEAMSREEVERMRRAVNRASTYGLTRPRCLARSIALMRLLHEAGSTDAMVRIGVRWDGAAFVAHAWVELDGTVLDLDPSLSAPFVPLTSMQLATPGRAR